MDVRGIIIAGAAPDGAQERFGEHSLALLDVLGQPLALRTAQRLRKYQTDEATLVAARESSPMPRLRIAAVQTWFKSVEAAPDDDIWRICEQVFSECAQDGAELVLVQRMGPYLELNYDELIQFHLDQHGRVTRVVDEAGKSLEAFVISASRRNDAAFLFRHQLTECRSECVDYVFRGYGKRLQAVSDLRQIARDALFQVNEVIPDAKHARPGVWIAPNARIERGARLVAPCFIGERARVRAGAVVTRASALERHAEVDCGSVIEDGTLLPYTKLGAGLDCTNSVAGFERLMNLARAIEIQIADPRLLASISPQPAHRVIGQAVSIVGLLARALPALFTPAQNEAPEATTASPIAPELQSSIREMKSSRASAEEEPAAFDKVRALLRL